MGVALKDIVTKEEIELKDLKGKIIAIDAFNMLYQFLTTIRAPDGNVFTDSSGRTTSHLIGLFSRLSRFLEAGLKPAFIFDGEAPELKKAERARRRELKEEAQAKYEIAVQEEDTDSMKKYAARTSRLTEDMINDAKELISAFGAPIIQAPSEGEAQAAFMVQNGDAYACVSQDYDSLLFGCQVLVHNLSIAGKKKKIKGIGFRTVKPEMIKLSELLNSLGIDRDGLIALGMLVGTDYNIGGIKGIGPKNALKHVKQSAGDYEKMFNELKWSEFFDTQWKEVFNLFKTAKVTQNYSLSWKPADKAMLQKILVEQHNFSQERVNAVIEKLKAGDEEKKQASLNHFFS
jgi:flap endonuclease-1